MHGKLSSPTIPSSPRASNSSIQTLLNVFFFLNVLQFLGVMVLAYLQRRKRLAQALRHRASFTRRSDHQPDAATVRKSFGSPEEPSRLLSPNQENRLLGLSEPPALYSPTSPTSRTRPSRDEVRAKREARRGGIFTVICAALIISAWVLFLGTAWFRLGMKKGSSDVNPSLRSSAWTRRHDANRPGNVVM